MPQMKEQKKSPKKQLNEMEASSLPDTEFKTVVMRVLKELRARVDELRELKEIINIEKDIDTIKKNQSEMKNTISEMREESTAGWMKQRIQSAIWRTRWLKTPN